jgi:hypothetical protein
MKTTTTTMTGAAMATHAGGVKRSAAASLMGITLGVTAMPATVTRGDEDIPIIPPLSPTPFDDEDVAVNKSNEIRIGPITRARAKLLEQ